MSIVSAKAKLKSKKKKKSSGNGLFQASWGRVKQRISLSGGMDVQVSKFVLSEIDEETDEDQNEQVPKKYTIAIKEANGDVADEWGLTLQEMNELTALGAQLKPSYRNEANDENLWQSRVVVNSVELGQKIWDDWFTPRLIANIMCKPNENL